MTHENLGSLGNLMFFCVSAKLLNFLNFTNFIKKKQCIPRLVEYTVFFTHKADAKRALLYGFYPNLVGCRYISRARKPR